jgi:DNA-binding MarR family transcriptional regulator/ribosomal protein S18 acetylase RimI-like enzyme
MPAPAPPRPSQLDTPSPTSPSDDAIESVRGFNRLYTRRIGVLEDGYLHSPYSLAEVRVLYELAHRDQPTATELARDLDLDPGYLSRILRRFDGAGLLEKHRSARDGRESHLVLTAHGHQTLAPLEASARDQIAALLAQLSPTQRQRLIAAMLEIGDLLGEPPASAPDYVLRQPMAGDFGWVVQRHGALYAEEYAFDAHFEALVASIVAKFVEHFDPERERCWIAERHGEPVGCVFLVRASRRVAKLRLFLVEPRARGLGIGSRMVDELLAFARAAGYHTVRLWTQSNLLAARRIYARAGFRIVAEAPHHSFGQDLVAETWDMRL